MEEGGRDVADLIVLEERDFPELLNLWYFPKFGSVMVRLEIKMNTSLNGIKHSSDGGVVN